MKLNNHSIWTVLICLMLIVACNPDSRKTLNEEVENKPNILFLFADDQRSSTINALGNSEVITPNLDQLVKEGTTFVNTYIMGAMNGAVCSPSRAMVMTGRYLFNLDPTGQTIDPAFVTVPKTLEKAGYHNYHVGKWHNGRDAFSRSFTDGGKIFFGGMHSHYGAPNWEYNAEKKYDDTTQNPLSSKHSSELYADAAIDFLESYDGEYPFYMNVSFRAPHDPREMPQAYLDMYDDIDVQVPQNFMTEHPFDNGELDIRDEWLAAHPRTSSEVVANIKAYYAMITHLDEHIGRILKTLEDKGLADNTIVVFSSDNGLAVGQHGLMGKQNLYEHSIKVPLIFKGPGIEAGEKVEALTYLQDLYPTFCDYAAINTPATVEGKSLKPSLSRSTNFNRESMFFAYKNFQRAARNDRWKIIKYNVEGKMKTQLFDLDNDPFETINLAEKEDYKEQLDLMEELLAEEMRLNNDKAKLGEPNWGVPVLPAWKDKNDPKAVERLRKMAQEERKMRGYGS